MSIPCLMSRYSRQEQKRVARMFNRAFDPDFVERQVQIKSLWDQYLDEEEMEMWSKAVSADKAPDWEKLRCIEEARKPKAWCPDRAFEPG